MAKECVCSFCKKRFSSLAARRRHEIKYPYGTCTYGAKEKSKKFVFTIGAQSRKENDQDVLRTEIRNLLEVCPVKYELVKLYDNTKDYKWDIPFPQKFKFNTMEEARDFAIKVLNTGAIFFSSLKKEQ